jgi:hypothetical protein
MERIVKMRPEDSILLIVPGIYPSAAGRTIPLSALRSVILNNAGNGGYWVWTAQEPD